MPLTHQRKRKSLHFRLLRVITYSLVLAIALSGTSLLIIGNHSAERYNTENMAVIGQILAEKIAFPLSLGDGYADEAEKTLGATHHHKDFALVCLYDLSGNLFSQYRAATSTHECLNTYHLGMENHNRGRRNLSSAIVLPVNFESEKIGYLVIESLGNQLKETLWLMTWAILGSLLVALLIAFLFGSRQLKKALWGLSDLRNTGLEIATNPKAITRAKKVFNDEIGDLVDAFNSMLDALGLESQKLRTSENTFRSLSENAPVGMFLRDSANHYGFVNSTWSEMTGLTVNNARHFSNCIGTDHKRHYIEKLASLKTDAAFVVNEFEFLHYETNEYRFLQEYVSSFEDGQHSHFIGILIDATELRQSQIELEKLAYYDPLTKLPNRRFLTDHLNYSYAAAEKKGGKIAVFMTDLDNFKRVNDSLGHDAGDKLLEHIGTRLKGAVFKEDVVSRMGGDEFLVLVEGIENLNAIEFISKRLLNAMRTESAHDISTLPVTGSIGVAVYPDDSCSPEELLRHADLALYSSKSNGGDQFSCYSEDLDNNIREQIRIEQKLRRAIDNKEIDVFLQPQVLSKERRVCWAEALVRWHDDEEGFISPVRFIPVAEDTGLIMELGDLVLEKVCIMLKDYAEELELLQIEGISVNLSAKQFFSNTLVKDISATLKAHQIAPSLVEFELTESTVTDNMDRAVSIMEDLRELGCRLSIDDFGTGYSSLSYLSKFPTTSLKIDRSFVDPLPDSKNDAEIVCAIIDLAHNLGMSVVAEGVETEAQADYLAEKGCEYLQGYYFARPASITQLISEATLKKNKKRLSN